jgi:serine/threonine-protein kinase
MAPEQLTANPIDRRIDIWSLGVALWEMLTMRRLFRRDTTANTIHAVLYEDLVPPSAHRAHVPPELDEIVMKALAREPQERWQTARDMGRAIRQFLSTRDELVGPAELSDWMGEVFPQGEARKSQLMDVARLGHNPVPAMPHPSDNDGTVTATNLLLGEAASTPDQRLPAKQIGIGLGAMGSLAAVAALVLALSGPGEEVDMEPAVTTETAPEPAPIVTAPTEPTEPSSEATPSASAIKPRVTTTPSAEPKKKRQARKAPLKTGPGTINLVTRGGWAEVYKGRKLLGSTPRRLTLPAGRHRLVLKPFGEGTPRTVFVVVEAGKTKNVSIQLE